MKVYISVDMEGIAGHTGWDQIMPGRLGYEASQVRMTEEATAAVQGAFDGGATGVVVNDAHDGMRNLIPELLDPRADLVSGAPKPYSMVQGLDGSFDLAFFVGYHAAAGEAGVLAHTYSLDPVSVRVNGAVVGELGLNALVAGAWGVAVGLATGDDLVAQEAERTVPWAERVVVKEAAGRFAACSVSPERSQKAIREAARKAAHRRSEMRPRILEGPLTLEVSYRQAGMADVAALLPGSERTGPRDIRYVAPDAVTLYRAFRLMNTVAGAARDG